MKEEIKKRPFAPSKKIILSKDLVEAWQSVLIELGRFPKGTRKTEATPFQLVKILAKSERNNIMDLREVFTQRRSKLTKRLLSHKKDLVSYLLGFHLANAARLQLTLARVETRWQLAAMLAGYERIHVNDLGCGAGAMSQAWLAFLRRIVQNSEVLHFHLIDNSQVLLAAAKEMLLKAASLQNVFVHKSPVESFRFNAPEDKELAIISLGYLWNEISKNQKARQRLMSGFSSLVKHEKHALLAIVEPGTQDQSRAMMQLRDELVELGYKPLYPCPHAQACPMLERSRDWCYSEFDWQRPQIQEVIDRLSSTDRTMLASSVFLFASPEAFKRLSRETEVKATVVGRPVKKRVPTARAVFDYLLCTGKAVLEKKPAEKDEEFKQRGEIEV